MKAVTIHAYGPGTSWDHITINADKLLERELAGFRKRKEVFFLEWHTDEEWCFQDDCTKL